MWGLFVCAGWDQGWNLTQLSNISVQPRPAESSPTTRLLQLIYGELQAVKLELQDVKEQNTDLKRRLRTRGGVESTIFSRFGPLANVILQEFERRSMSLQITTKLFST
jgi:hypothetical protein